MKNKHILLTGLLTLGLGFTSCDSFLDRAPLDQVTPQDFFNNDDDLAAYAIGGYNFTTKGGFGLGAELTADNHTDNMATTDPSLSRWVPNQWYTSMGGSIGFGNIRRANYFFNEVLPKNERGEITGSMSRINHYIGEVYFQRAWQYFSYLKSYGDFPILKEVLPDDKEILVQNSKREPRNEVARFILEDLDKAIELMGNDAGLTANKNRLSKNAALLVKSRVALYEASWLKYHNGTARVPNGPEWPGKRLHPNYQFPAGSIEQEIEFFLKEAMSASKELLSINLQQQGEGLTNPDPNSTEFSGWNSYYEMFCAEDMSKFDEVIMWRAYDNSQNINHGVSLYVRRGGNTGLTKGYVESFLMDDGKPIYAAGDKYKGDKTLDNVKVNRDPRLQLFMLSDGDRFNTEHNINKETEELELSTFGGEKYFPFILNLKETKMTTGYGIRKGYNYNPKYESNGPLVDETGSIVFRAAEAYLNFVEASYMLNNSLTSEARSVWAQIRERAGLPASSIDVTIQNTDLAKEAKGDWAVYSAGEMVDATLYNIRRERRSEFIGEGMRYDDLIRWCALNQVRDYVIEGFNLWDNYTDRYLEEVKNEETGEIKLVTRLIQQGEPNRTANVSAKSDSKYILPYRIRKVNNDVFNGYNWRQAKYLSPVPIRHIQLASPTESVDDSNFYQNPGWPTEGAAPAIKSNDPLDN